MKIILLVIALLGSKEQPEQIYCFTAKVVNERNLLQMYSCSRTLPDCEAKRSAVGDFFRETSGLHVDICEKVIVKS